MRVAWVFVLTLAFVCLSNAQKEGERWHRLNLESVPLYSDGPSAHPKGRRNAAAWCTDDDQIYVYGGKDESARLADMWRYEESSDRWLWLPGGPGPALSGMIYWSRNDDQLWMYGGRDDGGSIYGDLWKYERSTRTWSRMATATSTSPGPRFGSASWYRASTSTLYLYGGRSGIQEQEQDLWALDMTTLTWTLVRPINAPGALDDAHATIAQDRAYLFGGAGQNNTLTSNTLWAYNLDNNTWTSLGRQGPGVREDFTMWHSVSEDSIFLFGGKTADRALDEIWKYHIPSAMWSRISEGGTRPSSRWGTSVCTDDEGYAFLFGGTTFDQMRLFNGVWKYGLVYSRPGLLDNLDRVSASAMLAAVMSTLVFVGGVITLCVSIAKKCALRRIEKQPLQTL